MTTNNNSIDGAFSMFGNKHYAIAMWQYREIGATAWINSIVSDSIRTNGKLLNEQIDRDYEIEIIFTRQNGTPKHFHHNAPKAKLPPIEIAVADKVKQLGLIQIASTLSVS